MRVMRRNFRRGFWRLCMILQICWTATVLITLFVVYPWNQSSEQRDTAFQHILAEARQCRDAIDIPSEDFVTLTGKLEEARKERLADRYKRVALCDKSEEEQLVAFRARPFRREAYAQCFAEFLSLPGWKATALTDVLVLVLVMAWPSVLYGLGFSLVWMLKIPLVGSLVASKWMTAPHIEP